MASSAKFLDTVKAEAMLCYQRTSLFKTLMTVLVACSVLLVLHSCCPSSSLSLAVNAVYHYLRLLHLFRRPLWAFLLSNAIIIAVAILSVTDDRRRKTRTAPELPDELEVSWVTSAPTVMAAGAAACRPVRRSVDDLSNEEFNRTVENYIVGIRLSLEMEQMADLTVVPIES